MYTWRLKGYVPDSDEEDEDLDIVSVHSNLEPERAETSDPIIEPTTHELVNGIPEDGTQESNAHEALIDSQRASPTPSFAPVGQIVPTSTLTLTPPPPPPHAPLSERDRTESPDILQACLSPSGPSKTRVASSQSVVLDASTTRKKNASAGFEGLAAFGLLDDFSSDESLSDPPSDIETEILGKTVYASSQRNALVQVIIPQSPAVVSLQDHQERSKRLLRERRPIQVHPYLLEGRRTEQTFRERGIRLGQRFRSPVRQSVHAEVDSQDVEFEPENDHIPSGLLEPANSSPVATPKRVRDVQLSSARRRRRSSTQTRQPGSGPRKIRKLNRGVSLITSTDDAQNSISDPWELPPSPPHADDSPAHLIIPNFERPIARSPEINLPTPGLSSSLQGDAQGSEESDHDEVRSVRESTQRRRPVVIASDDASVEGSTSDEADHNQAERTQDDVLPTYARKIKGVLPASWIRIDQRKKNTLSKHSNEDRSAVQTAPQRGVAQKVVRNTSRTQQSPQQRTHNDVPVIELDDSEEDVIETPVPRSMDAQQYARTASDLAAVLDQRYADDDSDMEDDRLHLFTLGGSIRKRKLQTKLTDAFTKAKRPKLARVGNKASLVSAARDSRRSRRTPPPALSVLDFDNSPSSTLQNVPDFIKVARRAARQRPDLARGSPTNKHIRLRTARDTKDACDTLQKWRNGALKQKTAIKSSKNRIDQRIPLVQTDANKHHNPNTSDSGIESHDLVGSKQTGLNGSSHLRSSRNVNRGLLRLQQRISSTQGQARQPRKQSALRYRPAQLEGDESQFKQTDRRFEFAKGLQQVDQQYNLYHSTNQTSRNPLVAQYLADDSIPVSPLPSEREVEEKPHSPNKKPRLPRKLKARRVEVEAREYRQPSEPNIVEILGNDIPATVPQVETEHNIEENILQGLGPYGTRYSTTFDISPLQPGTYFHTSTFIGSGELHLALPNNNDTVRDLDEVASFVTISFRAVKIRCGPWNDDNLAQISKLFDDTWLPLSNHDLELENAPNLRTSALEDSSRLLRSLINYVAVGLSFVDPVDRQFFCTGMKRMIDSLYMHALDIAVNSSPQETTVNVETRLVRMTTYLMVLASQIRRIAQHPIVDQRLESELAGLSRSILQLVVSHLLRKAPQLNEFLEKNRLFAERENGIQDTDVLVESLVICMQVEPAGMTFWDVVAQELAPQAEKAKHVRTFESLWATLFAMLPFVELDNFGILKAKRRTRFSSDKWSPITAMLKQLFSLYPQTHQVRGLLLNDYVRASLSRVHLLIHNWHWHRCDSVLRVIFDFFANNNLRLLRHEQGNGSANFLGDLFKPPSLDLTPNDSSFQIFLKCLALGLQGMREMAIEYSDKKLYSFVLRLVPNHGRIYPKDQGLTTDDLEALRNHHDLLSTLYWASRPTCRPKLELIRGLVHHEHSHREACKLSVRTWANLTAFQISTKEPYSTLQPFAQWHNDMKLSALKQYRLAKTDAEEALKAESRHDTSASSIMVRQTVEKNQEQVLATLHDCIAGLRKAVDKSLDMATSGDERSTTVRAFLEDSGVVSLLELPHLNDKRLVLVIRETLGVLLSYAKLMRGISSSKISQTSSNESQDYGDLGDLDLAEFDPQPARPLLEFIETPLWHLLSNAFGAESAPNDQLLMDCIDTWAAISACQVSMGLHTWPYFFNMYGKVSWRQLRGTEQKRKFGPYFMAALVECASVAYADHQEEVFTMLLCCLAERESMLRFQHRLLQALIRVHPAHPLLRNLPFFANDKTGEPDITADTLRVRRLSLISSLLANMRDDFHTRAHRHPREKEKIRSEYKPMLEAYMATMKENYLQLGRTSATTGVYVEFVQKNVQFLQQYTTDICRVDSFFVNSVTFPTPATDPTYVVGRLCSYALDITKTGIVKELSTFMQAVAQQAVAGGQQVNLVHQLKTVLCGNEISRKERIALRDALMQGIFPAYVEIAFTSLAGSVVAVPILQSLQSIAPTILHDMRVLDESSIRSAYETMMAIVHAFIRSTEKITEDIQLLKQAHVLAATSLMLEAMMAVVPVLQYIYDRWLGPSVTPVAVKYLKDFTAFVAQVLHEGESDITPSYEGDADKLTSSHAALLPFSRDGLRTELQTHWSMKMDGLYFGHGHGQREVNSGIASAEEEKAALISGLEAFHQALANEYDDAEDGGEREGLDFLGQLDV